MDSTSTIVIVIATVVSVCATLYLFALSQVKFLKENWPQYRCNPLYMPMAGLVGQDVTTNFVKCTMKGFQDYSGFVMDPIMSEFSIFNDTIHDISGAMNDMRSMMSETRSGFLGIVGSVFGKIENLMSQFQYIIIRMRTLMGRVVGIMMSFMYIFYGGMQTGQSVANGPVGKTMSVLCFDQDTSLTCFNNHTIPMKNALLGMKLNNESHVTSIYKISGKNVQMYMLGDVKVSGSHKVLYGGRYIKVSEHPDSIPTEESEILACVNTTSHKLSIGGYEFLDFIENTDDSFLNFERKYVEIQYNTITNPKNKIDSLSNSLYPKGLSSDTKVALKGGNVPIYRVKIGDVLDNGDSVVGICMHISLDRHFCELDTDINLHPAMWVYNNGQIESVAHNRNVSYDGGDEKLFLFNLITENSMFPVVSKSGKRYMVLDELESVELKTRL